MTAKNIVLLFPGQGSQAIGMGRDLYQNFQVAKDVFEEVDDAIMFPLSKLIFEGEIENLNLTANTQPAIMATSIAALRVLVKELGFSIEERVAMMAGHSLGEYSAYCAAKTFSLADTAVLLKARGRAMQNAAPVGVGAMVALIGADVDTARELCAKAESATHSICQIANDNGASQIVLSGHTAAIDYVVEVSKDFGIRKAVKLPVSAPFHSKLMQPAAEVMAGKLEQAPASMPICPVINNVNVAVAHNEEEIKSTLVQQVCGTVRWRETMDHILQYSPAYCIEVGPGNVLTNLIKRTNKDQQTANFSTLMELEGLAKLLG